MQSDVCQGTENILSAPIYTFGPHANATKEEKSIKHAYQALKHAY